MRAKIYCVLVTGEQYRYMQWLAEKMELSLSRTTACMLAGVDATFDKYTNTIIFSEPGITEVYDEEYQRRRDDLAFRIKTYCTELIPGQASRYIRSIIRYRMETDEEYKKLKKEEIIP